MPRTRLHSEPTTVDVMDHVLDRGIVIETEREDTGARRPASTGRIVLLGVDTRVEIVTDLDDTLRSTETG